MSDKMGHQTEMERKGPRIKHTLYGVNLIIFIAGIVVTSLSIWALVGNVNYVIQMTNNEPLTAAIYVLLINGMVATFISILGCIGAAREIRWMLLTYFVVTLLQFFTILISGILGYNHSGQFIDLLYKQMQDSMRLYKEKKDIAMAWDYLQRNVHCCSIKTWREWYNYLKDVPLSCCKTYPNDVRNCNILASAKQYDEYSYSDGCFDKIKKFMDGKAVPIATTIFFFTIVMVFGLICAFALSRIIRRGLKKLS